MMKVQECEWASSRAKFPEDQIAIHIKPDGRGDHDDNTMKH